MKYKIWMHMDFPKTGCFSDVVMLHDMSDSIYVRALNLIDIIQSTYLMNVNHETMYDNEYGFNIRYDETPADHIDGIIKDMIYKLDTDPDLEMCHRFTKTDNFKLKYLGKQIAKSQIANNKSLVSKLQNPNKQTEKVKNIRYNL